MEKLLKQFNKVKNQIPFDRMVNCRDTQTLLGDVLEWCRDYFNEPKNFPLAYMLVGWWYTEKEVEKKLTYFN